jgi:hypothetical protein
MENYNYKFVGNCDVSLLKEKINQLSEQDWLEHQLRQNMYEFHKHTNTLEVLWDIDSLYNNKIGKVHNNFFKLNIESFLNQIEHIYQSTYGEGYFVRILITKLKSNTEILPHIDGNDSLVNCKRTHIPIFTSPECVFIVGEESKHMKEGEIWEINNGNKTHSVENNSNQDRIHIIIDYNLR